MEITKIIAQNVRKLRKEKGLSQEELADIADISTRVLGSIERNECNPTFQTINSICLALNVTLNDLTKEDHP